MLENEKKLSPPYVPFSSFKSFIKGLGETTMPLRVDKSVMTNYSGSTIYALLPALTWFGLIDPSGIPTDRLKDLASSSDSKFPELLGQLVREKYDFLFENGLDLEKASGLQVQDAFRSQDVSGSTVTKCMVFFLAAAKEASIKVSPHVKAPTIKRKTRAKKTKTETPTPNLETPIAKNSNEHEGMERIPIPLRGSENGAVYLPEGLEGKEAKRAVKVVKFLLEEYYELDDD